MTDSADSSPLVDSSRGEAWERVCRVTMSEMEIQLCRGNWEAAHGIIDRLRERSGLVEPALDPRELPLAAVFSTRLANELEKQFGVLTVGALNQVPWSAISTATNIGPGNQNEILRAWKALGFTEKRSR